MTHDEIMANFRQWQREFAPFPQGWNEERLACYNNDLESAYLQGYRIGRIDTLSSISGERSDTFRPRSTEACVKMLIIQYNLGMMNLTALISHLSTILTYKDEVKAEIKREQPQPQPQLTQLSLF